MHHEGFHTEGRRRRNLRSVPRSPSQVVIEEPDAIFGVEEGKSLYGCWGGERGGKEPRGCTMAHDCDRSAH